MERASDETSFAAVVTDCVSQMGELQYTILSSISDRRDIIQRDECNNVCDNVCVGRLSDEDPAAGGATADLLHCDRLL